MPTGRNGRLRALILMLIAVASVYLVVVPLMNLYAERQSVLENRRMLLSRLRAAAEELPGLRAERRPGGSATPGLVTPALNAGLDVYGFRTNENPVVAKP
jgi:type II secretory pathway component PulM